MTAVVDTAFSTESGSKRADRVRLFAQPAAVIVIVGAALVWALTRNNDAIEAKNLNLSTIGARTWQHLLITIVVAAFSAEATMRATSSDRPVKSGTSYGKKHRPPAAAPRPGRSRTGSLPSTCS